MRAARLFCDIATRAAVQTRERRAAAARGARQRRRRSASRSTAGRVTLPARRCRRRRRRTCRARVAGGRRHAADAMSEQIQPIRGMNDVLPAEIGAWQHLERVTRELLAAYGYEEIRVPVVEHTELFKRSIGEYTDIVEKEMYTFTDTRRRQPDAAPRGDRRHRARGDLQRPAARRAPEAVDCRARCSATSGRRRAAIRQFHQIDVEAIGFAGPDVDAELIALDRAAVARARHHARAAAAQFAGHARGAQRVPRAAGRLFPRARAALDADSQRRLERQSAAHPRQQEPGDAGADRAARRCSPSTSTPNRARISTRCARRSTALGIAYVVESAPGARPRLLLAHRVRVGHRCARRAGRRLLRRPLRRPRSRSWAARRRRPSASRMGVERVVALLAPGRRARRRPRRRTSTWWPAASAPQRAGAAAGRAAARRAAGPGRRAEPGRRQFQGAVPPRRQAAARRWRSIARRRRTRARRGGA